jgi:hypothetical protein
LDGVLCLCRGLTSDLSPPTCASLIAGISDHRTDLFVEMESHELFPRLALNRDPAYHFLSSWDYSHAPSCLAHLISRYISKSIAEARTGHPQTLQLHVTHWSPVCLWGFEVKFKQGRCTSLSSDVCVIQIPLPTAMVT